ncbi:kinase-like domain-containing protein [Lasiosphaeria ovina]|uniref:Kinase-like domain-containing protein n=1 Tax=Lasiosphaeria ovina TaxID=92902 RepID=A0AAE0JTE4_9PEZI|nr:kinase-like domain-containing protein [Lasiosphaeria ovina]
MYFPGPVIDQLLAREAVLRQFLEAGRERGSRDLARWIVRKAPNLFVITIMSQPEAYDKHIRITQWFRKNGTRDSTLNIEVSNGGDDAQTRHRWGPKPWLDSDSLHKADPRLRNISSADALTEHQWKVLVPVLSTKRIRYNFRVQTILPFTVFANPNEANGAFDDVYKAKIHAGYFVGYAPISSPLFPSQKHMIEQNFAKEAETLRIMNSHFCKNILRFVTAFSKGEDAETRRYFIIFEWAGGGSLEDLFEHHHHPEPVLSKTLVKEVIEQIAGLSHALEATHNKAKIRHGDLKPLKILWGEIHWDLEDWRLGPGQNHVNSIEWRGQEGLGTGTKYGTSLYEPPEVELGDVKVLGRQYDIWSMGCIMSEILIRLFYGYEGVKQFRSDVNNGQTRRERTMPCYEVVRDDNESQTTTAYKAKLRPVVEDWMDYIVKAPMCQPNMALGALNSTHQTGYSRVELPPQRAETRLGDDG